MSKKLVAYFSATGITARVAENLADSVGADFFAIIPATGYTKENLDWMDKSSRSSVEIRNESCRPEIAYKRDNMSEYDMIFVGFPIWLAYHKLIQCTFGCQRVHFYDYPYSKNDRVHLPRIYGILW